MRVCQNRHALFSVGLVRKKRNKAPTFTSWGFAMSKSFCNFKTYNKLTMVNLHNRPHINNQLVLFPERIDRDIAENDPVRIINGVINGLNLDCLAKLYRSKGRRAYNARMMLKVIIYAYMNNVYSCRKIENLLKRDIHFIWLAGYEQPDFITINRFRNRLKDEIGNLFTQMVLILAERGFVSLEVEYIDGTKINPRRTSTPSYGARRLRRTAAKDASNQRPFSDR